MRFLIIFLISFSAMANFALRSEIESKTVSRVFVKKPASGDYLKLPKGYHKDYFIVVDEMAPDTDQPIYEAKSNVVACTDEADCLQKEIDQVCDTANGYFVVRLQDNTEVYCTKLLGYVDIPTGNKVVIEDAALKSSFEAAKSLKEAKESSISEIEKDMRFGSRMRAIVRLMSESKGLSKGQRKTLRTNLKDIDELLNVGDICGAREDIAALTADGTLITSQNITDALSEIDSYKSCP